MLYSGYLLTNKRTTCEPMKPAPPVITIFLFIIICLRAKGLGLRAKGQGPRAEGHGQKAKDQSLKAFPYRLFAVV